MEILTNIFMIIALAFASIALGTTIFDMITTIKRSKKLDKIIKEYEENKNKIEKRVKENEKEENRFRERNL